MGLFDVLQKMPSLNEMKGNFGEQLAKYYSKIMTDAFILHDVLIDGADGFTSQIDLIMIGSKGLYVVEVKMYSDAVVYGSGQKSQWYYYVGGNKYEIYSPVKQNKKHIKYLKDMLKEFGDVPCFSVIAMVCKDFKVSNINENPDDITTVICSSLPAMSRGIEAVAKDKPVVFSAERKHEIYQFIQNNQYSGKEKRIEHKEKVMEYKQNLNDLRSKNLCPECGGKLVLRSGKFGEFYGCSNYPKCKYTQKK